MKSILNDINRLEKAYSLLQRIVKAHSAVVAGLQVQTPRPDIVEAQRHLHAEIRVARAFLAKCEGED